MKTITIEQWHHARTLADANQEIGAAVRALDAANIDLLKAESEFQVSACNFALAENKLAEILARIKEPAAS
jgi:hypothetical protein